MSISSKVVAGVLSGAVALGVGGAFGVRALQQPDGQTADPRSSVTSTPQPSETGESAPSSPSPTSEPSRDASTKAPTTSPTEDTTQLEPLSKLVVIPGAVGPVRAGMSRDEANATGYLEYKSTNESCEGPLWQWKPDYRESLDLSFPSDGSKVASIGIRGEFPRTRSGYGVGTTWKELKSVVDQGPEMAGYSQTGVYVQEGDAWIGFLFDVSTDELTDDHKVMMMEVTTGTKPGLMRDGC